MKKRVIIFLFVVILLAVITPFCFAQEEELLAKGAAVVKKPASAEQYDKETEQALKQLQDKIKYTSSNLRDPFTLALPQAPVAPAPKGPLPQFKIEGYVWGSSLPQAIIDGKVYSEGDVIQGAKIMKIDKDGITVLFNEITYIIK
ncbi:MAG: general secretion pathway protein GspB [Candidatus Omnitrophica bacterium]|nr:general secretion pathway protein GspB [Candidatus Omnitrophota bacterium]